MRIVIVGAGVVGMATGRGLLRGGHAVSFVDSDPARLDRLRGDGFAASDSLHLGGPGVLAMVSVPTPAGPGLAGYDLRILRAVSVQLGEAIREADELPTVVLRSTTPPGTCDQVVRPILEERSGLESESGFALAANPEFLRADSALEDFLRPRVTVIGSRSKATCERLVELYRPFGGDIRSYEDPAMAELVKLTHNLYNAAKISFFNEIWHVSEVLGLDGHEVGKVVARSAEASWNIDYGVRGGKPFAGACLPKDTRGFVQFIQSLGMSNTLAQAVEAVNLRMSEPPGFSDVAGFNDVIDVREGLGLSEHESARERRH